MPTSLTTGERAGLRNLVANSRDGARLGRHELVALLDMADEAARLRAAIEAHRHAHEQFDVGGNAIDRALYAALGMP